MVEKISFREHKKLIALVNNSDAIKDCSNKTGLPVNSLRNIAKAGSGDFYVIGKLRVYINYKRSKLFIESAA